MKRLKDQRLYTDNNYAVNRLREGIDLGVEGFDYRALNEKITCHCYWYGNVDRKQAFSIKSFLCTQNMRKCKIILWIDTKAGFDNYYDNTYIAPLLPLIEVRYYDPVKEIQGTPWQDQITLVDEQCDLPKRSDAFRYLILYKYGGLYFDLDVMFLKDFSDLLNIEFCYTWEDYPYANSALLNLKCGGEMVNYLLEKSILKKDVLPWTILRFDDASLEDLFVFPCAVFDPVWQGLTLEDVPYYDFTDYFKPFGEGFINKLKIQSYRQFFPGCYAYHWHNQWKSVEHTNSFFGIFEQEFNRLLRINY